MRPAIPGICARWIFMWILQIILLEVGHEVAGPLAPVMAPVLVGRCGAGFRGTGWPLRRRGVPFGVGRCFELRASVLLALNVY
jgi:hypothetical protein